MDDQFSTPEGSAHSFTAGTTGFFSQSLIMPTIPLTRRSCLVDEALQRISEHGDAGVQYVKAH